MKTEKMFSDLDTDTRKLMSRFYPIQDLVMMSVQDLFSMFQDDERTHRGEDKKNDHFYMVILADLYIYL